MKFNLNLPLEKKDSIKIIISNNGNLTYDEIYKEELICLINNINCFELLENPKYTEYYKIKLKGDNIIWNNNILKDEDINSLYELYKELRILKIN